MMDHLEYLKEVVVEPIEFHRREIRKLSKTVQKIKEHEGEKFAYVSELREEKIIVNGDSRTIRRVFVNAHDTMLYVGIGWVLCDDIDQCMVCNHQFSMLFDPKIHCHACGNIICAKCSHLADIYELRKFGPMPVCKFCDWGQATIKITPSPADTKKIAPIPIRAPKYGAINLWHYGRVEIHNFIPAFVIRTRRVNKTRLYVNVCMCEAIPLNIKSVIAFSKSRLPLDQQGGAIDRIRHTLSWEAARNAERARKEGEQLERRKLAEEAKRRELAEWARMRALETATEGGSEEEYSLWDSELESDISDSDDESAWTYESSSDASSSVATMPVLTYQDLSAMQVPNPLRGLPRRATQKTMSVSDLSMSDTEVETTYSESSKSSSMSAFGSFSSRSRRQQREQRARDSFQQKLHAAAEAFLALKSEEATMAERAIPPEPCINQSDIAGAHTGVGPTTGYVPPRRIPRHEYADLEFETLIPRPKRRGFQRTPQYYEFSDSSSSNATSEDSDDDSSEDDLELTVENNAIGSIVLTNNAAAVVADNQAVDRAEIPPLLEQTDPVVSLKPPQPRASYLLYRDTDIDSGGEDSDVETTSSAASSQQQLMQMETQQQQPELEVDSSSSILTADSLALLSPVTVEPELEVPPADRESLEEKADNPYCSEDRPQHLLNRNSVASSEWSSTQDSLFNIPGVQNGEHSVQDASLQLTSSGIAFEGNQYRRSNSSVPSEWSSTQDTIFQDKRRSSASGAHLPVPIGERPSYSSDQKTDHSDAGERDCSQSIADSVTNSTYTTAPSHSTTTTLSRPSTTAASSLTHARLKPSHKPQMETHFEQESGQSDWTSSSVQDDLGESWDRKYQSHSRAFGAASYLPVEKHAMYLQKMDAADDKAVNVQEQEHIRDSFDSSSAATEADRLEAQVRLEEIRRQLTRSVEERLEALGPDPLIVQREAEEAELERQFAEAAPTDSGEESEYEEELPVDTYLVCGEKGRALDLRDVFDVAVNPEVIHAANADLTGDLLIKLTQQVLISVSHVQNDQQYPSFDYIRVPENYQRRILQKTPEQLEAEARAAKLREERLAAEKSLSFTTFLTYLGLSTTSAEEGEEEDLQGDDASESSEEADMVMTAGGLEKLDKRPLQMSVPTLAAFLHLTAVASHRSLVKEVPWNYQDCPEAVYPSFNSAKTKLESMKKLYEYQSMVHKIKAAGAVKQVRFAAADFSLPDSDRADGGYAEYESDYGDDATIASSTHRSSVSRQNSMFSEFNDKDYSLLSSGQTLQRFVDKLQRAVTVVAKPGFVIKTRRMKDRQEKVFINVLHHKAIDELLLSGLVYVEPHEEPLTGVGESSVTTDRSGGKCIVYNVVIASSYIKHNFRRFERKITDAPYIVSIIETVNEYCRESLSTQDYCFPRAKHAYKGSNPQHLMTYTFKTRKPVVPRKYFSRQKALMEAQQREDGKKHRSSRRLSMKRNSSTKLKPVAEEGGVSSGGEVSEEEKSKSSVNRGDAKTAERTATPVAATTAASSVDIGSDEASMHTQVTTAKAVSSSQPDEKKVAQADETQIEKEEDKSNSIAGSEASEEEEEDEKEEEDEEEGEVKTARFSFGFPPFGRSSSSSGGQSRPASSSLSRKTSHYRIFGSAAGPDYTQVTADMIEYYKELSVDKEHVARLKYASVRNPQILLGWQMLVVLEAGQQGGLFVVTAVHRGNFMRSTEFQLSHPLKGDRWVKLRRNTKKRRSKGLFFFPTRKVMFLDPPKQTI